MDADHRQPRFGRQRLAHELEEYAIVAAYLCVCFGAILLYKASVLEDHGVVVPYYGVGLAKALILGKFMLIGQAFHLGERYRDRPLILAVLFQSAIFLVVLAALTYGEELLVGAMRGRTVAQSVSDIADGKWQEIAATCFLLWLILLPYFGVRQIGRALGDGVLRRMLFGKR
ncbi:hypothetical protein [Azospirillum rugosum]|uniref:Tripartite ATP-independent transporter, DctQ component n=1 Tax=Azospirillum rugosum TaxID=416170 RepID=A0ABS4SW34_9PROT|nr:hypothetical protein [Azospirillum rugosum]MBP2296774.1 hypothetical protein [Azospirillum rugosum]MDQ0530377.1 hypothetical protein [Azospirillum rugosum]